MSGAWNLLNYFSPNNQTGNLGVQSPSTPLTGIDGAAQFIAPQRLRDVVGKLKVSQSQNIYDADFEYGVQPLRWENFIQNVSGQASIVQNPGLGGVTMTIGGGNQPGDITIRQSRPYHRYQPGKTFYMASNVNFGASVQGQFQRVGIFDDSNGIFFMQQGQPYAANPYAMYVVIRSDSGGTPVDTVFPMDAWNGSKTIANALDWTKVQMIWMEYAWYGAGACRWGVVIDGEPWILHQVGTGNAVVNGVAQVKPWSRTGNLPVRYEQRDSGSAASSVMTHYGVSVLIEGSIDKQRGFTYSYGNYAAVQVRTIAANSIRFPAMSFRMRAVGTDQFDNTIATATSGTITSLSIATATPAITTIAGQYINGQALFTFASAHGYPLTNPAQANNPAQYITLSSFSQLGSATGYVYTSGAVTSTNAFVSNANVTGASGQTSFLVANAINPSTGFANSIAVGQAVTGIGVPANALVSAVAPYGTVSNPGDALNVLYPSTAIVTISTALTTQASGNYTFSAPSNGSVLTITTSTGSFLPSASLSGTGIASGTTITQQQSAFGSLATIQSATATAIGSTSITLGASTGVTAGMVAVASGLAVGSVVEGVGTTSVTLSGATVSALAANTVLSFYNTTATSTYVSGGVVGTSIITLTSATGFAVGQIFMGTGVPAGAIIQAIGGNTLTLTKNFTIQAVGQYSAQAPGANGAYALNNLQGSALSGTISATYTNAGGTYLISNVPNTTQLVLNIPIPNSVTINSTLPTATYWGANQYVGKFVYYNASLPSISAVSVGSATLIGGVTQYPATIAFSAAHNLQTGNVINIASASPVTYNGQFNFTVTSATGGVIYFGASSPGAYSSSAAVTSPYTARITSNTTNTITFGDVVTGLPLANAPASGNKYQIGLIDRGQLLPQTLLVNTSATALIELIASTPTNQLSLGQANFVPLNTLGSYNSFAEVDLAAANLTGGEVVYAFSTPNNALQQLDLSNFFPVLTNIKGNVADILTVAITTNATTAVQVNVVCQEAMA